MDVTIKKEALYERLHRDISNGVYASNYRFPPEAQLAQELGVSRNTLRSAFLKLEQDHLIVRIKSKGTFVSHAPTGRKLLALFKSQQDHTYSWHYLIPSVALEAEKAGFELETCDFYDFSQLDPEQVGTTLKEHNIYGVFVADNFFLGNEPILKLLDGKNVPVVLIHGNREDYQVTGWATLVADLPGAWKMAIRHLRDQGFQRIVTLERRHPLQLLRGRTRKEYLQLLEEMGMDTDERLILQYDHNDHETLRQKLRQVFMVKGDIPHAVMCFSDFSAETVYQVLKEAHLRVPEDVAVMGFYGAPICQFLSPSLSTVDLEYAETGRLAVKIMTKASQWFDPQDPSKRPPLIFAPYHLELRDSTRVRRFEAVMAQ